MTPSPAHSFVSRRSARSPSDMSLVSVDSRYSRLSRRSCSRPQASTEQIELARIEQGRQALREQLRQNAETYQRAIRYPELRTSGCSLDITVPEEFNLSTDQRLGPAAYTAAPAPGESAWATSLRRPSVSPGPQAWKPALTVPEGPRLRTASRPRSISARRWQGEKENHSWCDLQEPLYPRQSSRPHLVGVSSDPPAPGRRMQATSWAEERAERARREAQSRQDAALIEEKQRLCIFRPAAASTCGLQKARVPDQQLLCSHLNRRLTA